jgi:acyl dehydratase
MREQLVFRSRWFEDIPIGEFHVFGSHLFGEAEILEFRDRYGPPARRDGPPSAAPWHLCAVWMQLMVAYMERYAKGVNDGRRNGAGVGMHDVTWLAPVYPGHELTYTYEITEKLDKVVGGRWGIIRSRNEAFNHRGERVLNFAIDILAERAPAESPGAESSPGSSGQGSE